MKKFSFSLQRLLDYKGQLLDSQRAVLAEMNASLGRLRGELEDLREEQQERAAQYNAQIARGTTPMEILIYRNYRERLEAAIEAKTAQIALQEKAVSRQMDRVREMKQEISAMEKLREKRLEEYSYQEAKDQERFIEEIVSHARA